MRDQSEAKVAQVIKDTRGWITHIVLNVGSLDGVKLGRRFLVFGDGGEIPDPDSGEPLGRLELVRGRVEVTHVQERICTARSLESKILTPRTVKRTSSMLNSSHTEEITDPDIETVPLWGVQIGDRARPI